MGLAKYYLLRARMYMVHTCRMAMGGGNRAAGAGGMDAWCASWRCRLFLLAASSSLLTVLQPALASQHTLALGDCRGHSSSRGGKVGERLIERNYCIAMPSAPIRQEAGQDRLSMGFVQDTI